MIQTILANSLGKAMVVLPAVILANILFGVSLAEFEHKFDWNKMLKGLYKGVLIYVGIALFVIVFHFTQDLVIDFNGGTYTMVDAMYIIVWGTVLTYSAEGMKKLVQLFKYKVEGDE